MQEIDAWIQGGRNYSQGVMIYAKYGRFKRVLFILQRGETELNKGKLNDCLNRLNTEVQKEIIARTEAVAAISSPNKTITKTDDVIEGINKKWKPLYGEMAMLHSRLLAVETKELRYSLALRISDLHAQLVDYWEQIDYYQKHGKLPEKKLRKKVKEDIAPNELRALMNARSSLTNYTNKRLPMAVARLNVTPNAKNKKNLERTQAAIEKYKAIIKQYENVPETD